MKPSKKFSTRMSAATKWRHAAKPYIEEILKHCCPGREHDFDRGTSVTEYESTVFHSLPEELARDLAADLVTYYTPSEDRWQEYEVITPVSEDNAEEVKALVSSREDEFFDMIASSNYNDIAPQWGFEAATHGTPALWVTQNTIFQELHFEIVPPNELLIVPGFRGILDRFREMTVSAETLEAQLADEPVDLSSDKIRAKMDKDGTVCKLVYGFWLDWSDPARPQWHMEITVDGEAVTRAAMSPVPAPEGQETIVNIGDLPGSCPLLVGRFNPQPRRPWGRGAGWSALPDIRSLDTVEDIVQTGMDESLKRTLIYPDDGFIDMEEGLEAGRAYPASSGFTRDQIYEFPPVTNLDAGYYSRADFEERLRRLFYQDGPRQTGDTPPTATQWVDQRRRVQQRLGKPSAPLWSEMILPMVQRIEFLGVKSGRLKDALSHNGQAILVQPRSPLQKAQMLDQMQTSRANLDLGFQTLGEQTPMVIDMHATLSKHIDASGDRLTVLAPKQKKQQPTEGAAPNGAPAETGQ